MQRRRFLQNLMGASGVGIVAASVTPSTAGAADAARRPAVRFAHLTDVHLYEKRQAANGLTKALQHVQSLEAPPEFVLNGGDAIYDGLEADRSQLERQWDLWRRVWQQENSLPVRHCLGNHDIWGWNRAGSGTNGAEDGWGKAFSLDQLGLDRSYYDFEQGGWHFIVLDSMTPDDHTVYRAELGQPQMAWLRSRLQAVPSERPVVIVSHIPILTVGDVGWSRELVAQPIGHQMLRHQDRGELLRLFGNYPNVKLCLAGHTHLTEQISVAGITFLNSGAVSGLWWKGDNQHTDEGYRIVDLYSDGTFSTQYVSYGWDVPG